jgi:hypothetical protein
VKDGEEHAYLTDFGLARRSDTASDLTAKGLVVGTVDYMAPEQITGAHIDARTDIYALGCVFYQMLTGKVPYERENSVATLFSHVHDPSPPLEGAIAESFPEFAPVIAKAMAKDPGDRYLSAGDFARDAAAVLAGTRFTGPPTIVATGEATPTGSHAGVEEAAHSLVDLPKQVGGSETRMSEPAPAAEDVPEPAPELTAVPGEETRLAAPGSSTEAAPATEHEVPPAPAVAQRKGDRDGVDGGRSLKRYRLPGLAALVVIVAAAVVIVLSSSGSSGPAGTPFAAPLVPVPTNMVTGSGNGTVVLKGDVITVTLRTQGLLNGSPHALHIHAGGLGVCPPPSAAHLHNGHPSISTTDGIKWYGPPQVSLTSVGDTSNKSIIDFSRYPSTGTIDYKRTITIPQGIADAIAAGNAVMVVHGIDYNHNGIYDNVLDRSELNKGLPGEATAPALCGTLVRTQIAAVGGQGGSAATTYAVVFRRPVGTAAGQASSFALICHLASADASAATDPRASPGTAT